jgi:hypothetical protein
MPQNKLKINRPSLAANWTPEQMRAGAVRVHNRFAALLTAVIESADWANYRLSKRPIEVGRPAWPDPGEYCDLVLQRRNGPAEVALEIKTRQIKLDDYRSPGEILDNVLDHMGPQLHKLQKLAHQSEALWCVALGLYRVSFQSAAMHYETPFSIVMIWGRDIGRDGPMSRSYWHTLGELDRAMCSAKQISQFFELAHHKPSPRAEPEPDIEQLIARSNISRKRKQALLAVSKWPDKPLPLRTYLREFVTEHTSEYSLRHYVLDFINRGIVRGYKRGSKEHNLTIDEQALIAYLLQADHE